MVIDEDGNQVKSKNCEVKSYSLSVNEKNKLTLKITQGNGKIQSFSGVVPLKSHPVGWLFFSAVINSQETLRNFQGNLYTK